MPAGRSSRRGIKRATLKLPRGHNLTCRWRLKWKWNLIVIGVIITCNGFMGSVLPSIIGILDDAFHVKVQKPQKHHKSPSVQRLRNQLNSSTTSASPFVS